MKRQHFHLGPARVFLGAEIGDFTEITAAVQKASDGFKQFGDAMAGLGLGLGPLSTETVTAAIAALEDHQDAALGLSADPPPVKTRAIDLED
jgi:hypothetical protein